MLEVPLTQGLVALADEIDAAAIHAIKWHAHRGGNTYYARGLDPVTSKQVSMHRYLLGVTDKSVRVDHENLNGLDNRRANLRVVGRTENRWNSQKDTHYRGATTKSAYKGVTRSRQGWFEAAIQGEYLGTYRTETEAASAYDNEARIRFGDYARLNFPEQYDHPFRLCRCAHLHRGDELRATE